VTYRDYEGNNVQTALNLSDLWVRQDPAAKIRITQSESEKFSDVSNTITVTAGESKTLYAVAFKSDNANEGTRPADWKVESLDNNVSFMNNFNFQNKTDIQISGINFVDTGQLIIEWQKDGNSTFRDTVTLIIEPGNAVRLEIETPTGQTLTNSTIDISEGEPPFAIEAVLFDAYDNRIGVDSDATFTSEDASFLTVSNNKGTGDIQAVQSVTSEKKVKVTAATTQSGVNNASVTFAVQNYWFTELKIFYEDSNGNHQPYSETALDSGETLKLIVKGIRVTGDAAVDSANKNNWVPVLSSEWTFSPDDNFKQGTGSEYIFSGNNPTSGWIDLTVTYSGKDKNGNSVSASASSSIAVIWGLVFTGETIDQDGNGMIDQILLVIASSVLVENLTTVHLVEDAVNNVSWEPSDVSISLDPNYNDKLHWILNLKEHGADSPLETHLMPEVEITVNIGQGQNKKGSGFISDGVGSMVSKAILDYTPCDVNKESAALTIIFSESLAVEISDPNSNSDFIQEFVSNPGAFIEIKDSQDPAETFTEDLDVWGRLKVGDISFLSREAMEIRIPVSKYGLSDFSGRISNGEMTIKLGMGANGALFEDLDGNKVHPQNVAQGISQQSNAKNLICDVKQIGNPSGPSDSPFRQIVVVLNGAPLVPEDPGGTSDKKYEIDFVIYDLLGNKVITFNENLEFKAATPGTEEASFLDLELNWDYRNEKGRQVAAGGYIGLLNAVVVDAGGQAMGGRNSFPPIKIVVGN